MNYKCFKNKGLIHTQWHSPSTIHFFFIEDCTSDNSMNAALAEKMGDIQCYFCAIFNLFQWLNHAF